MSLSIVISALVCIGIGSVCIGVYLKRYNDREPILAEVSYPLIEIKTEDVLEETDPLLGRSIIFTEEGEHLLENSNNFPFPAQCSTEKTNYLHEEDSSFPSSSIFFTEDIIMSYSSDEKSDSSEDGQRTYFDARSENCDESIEMR